MSIRLVGLDQVVSLYLGVLSPESILILTVQNSRELKN
jgi:hypothetical protein